jgi:hypothetical protein
MRLKLYEVTSNETWWVASFDELGVTSLIREEMESRDYADDEIDNMLSEFDINELTKYEAESIGVSTRFDGDVRSLWSLYVSNKRECVLGTSVDQESVDLEGVEELNFDSDDY